MTSPKVKTHTPLPKVKTFQPSLGCDPEFFFKVNKRVVGAEQFIPDGGLTPPNPHNVHGLKPTVIIDGVQAELNPRPKGCRAYMVNEIKACFVLLKKELDKSDTEVAVSFDQSVTISKTELEKLDKKNQKFGCLPSLNAHGDTLGVKLEEVDPLTHKQRSAGGHIHIGVAGRVGLMEAVAKRPEQLIQMLDIICGNTCVLVDRDAGNKERRKLYGGAGEYRLPEHGIEYRTLSNFWLQSARLTSLVLGLTRLSVELCTDSNYKKYYKAFTKAVDVKDVTKAINENDFRLAYKNFKAIEPLLLEVISDANNGHQVFDKGTMREFHYFVTKIKQEGLGYWVKQDPLEHWLTLGDGHNYGFCDYLKTEVRPDLKKAQTAVKLAA